MDNTVTLPWPDKKLHPNSRTDRRHTTGIRKRYKQACWALCKAAKPDYTLTHLDITFHPPDGRRRDLDGMLGAIKYGLDGVALALGVDDYPWELTIRRGEKDPAKNGFVLIRFLPKQETTIPIIGTIS